MYVCIYIVHNYIHVEVCLINFSFSLRPLFPGSNELDQISKIHDVVGTPSSQVLDKFRKM